MILFLSEVTLNTIPIPSLSAKGLTCIRENRILFEELSFEINAGDIVQIEGPNGAGKTSLLRILAGLSQPYSGDVYFNGASTTQNRENYCKQMTYLGHTPGIKGEMTAQENLEFYLSLHELNQEEAEATLAQVNLLGFEDAPAANLSAGQHRRIALARLWQSKSPIWILDEPFTAIDKQGVKNLEQLFVQHAEQGGIVILTTHQDLALPKEMIKTISLTYRFF